MFGSLIFNDRNIEEPPLVLLVTFRPCEESSRASVFRRLAVKFMNLDAIDIKHAIAVVQHDLQFIHRTDAFFDRVRHRPGSNSGPLFVDQSRDVESPVWVYHRHIEVLVVACPKCQSALR